MRRSRHTEEQVAFALKQAELGASVAEVCRKMGVSEATLFRWKQKHGGLGPSELRRLRQLKGGEREAEEARGGPAARQSHAAGRAGKKALTPGRRRELVRHVRDAFGVGERRGCEASRFHRSPQRHRPSRDDQVPLRLRIREIAAARVRYGYPRVHVLLRREGWAVNRERVHRQRRPNASTTPAFRR